MGFFDAEPKRLMGGKMPSPAFQFYAADYLADENVAIMTLEEEGAYIRALAYCWREGSIPADSKKLSRLLKGASDKTIEMVKGCFNQDETNPSRMVHPRLEREREKQVAWRVKSSKGGRSKAQPSAKGATDLVEPKGNTSFSSSSSSSFSSSSLQGETPPALPPPGPDKPTGKGTDFNFGEGDIPDDMPAAPLGNFILQELSIPHSYGLSIKFADAVDLLARDEGCKRGEAATRILHRARERPPGDGKWRFWLEDGSWKASEELSLEGLE